MPPPVHRREFDAFLSHAHRDREFVDALYRWLSEIAGFRIWYDATELAGGSLIATELDAAIERCRGMLLVASRDAITSGWVRREYNVAVDESTNSDFRVVPLRLGNAEIGDLIRGLSWIEVPEAGLDSEAAVAILRAFYPGEKRPDPRSSRDVYVSASWRSGDNTSAVEVSSLLVNAGFRLIGDAKDQSGFSDGDRVERIVASCGAFVAVVPFRGTETANAHDSPYKYFMREIDIASELNLPSVVVADPRIRRVGGSDATWLRMETDSAACPEPVIEALDELWDSFRSPPQPHYVFCALDLDSPRAKRGSPYRHLVERITGMPTVVATEIHESPLQDAVRRSIMDSFLVLADITGAEGKAFNVDTSIEAGMALAAGTNIELVAGGEARRPPFMLRGLQMPTYQDDVELFGVVHDVVRPYRRRVINAEL